MTRDLPTVIACILTLVPASETDLRHGLERVQQSASFAAPEVMGTWWRKAAEVLSDYPDQSKDWLLNISKVFTNQAAT